MKNLCISIEYNCCTFSEFCGMYNYILRFYYKYDMMKFSKNQFLLIPI